MSQDSEDKLKEIYKIVNGVEIPEQIKPFTYSDFISYASNHETLSKIDWDRFFAEKAGSGST